MAVMVWIGQSHRILGKLTISRRHRFFGWSATIVMGLAGVVIFDTSF